MIVNMLILSKHSYVCIYICVQIEQMDSLTQNVISCSAGPIL